MKRKLRGKFILEICYKNQALFNNDSHRMRMYTGTHTLWRKKTLRMMSKYQRRWKTTHIISIIMSTTTTDIPNMLRNRNKKRQQRHCNSIKTNMNSLNNFGLVGWKICDRDEINNRNYVYSTYTNGKGGGYA